MQELPTLTKALLWTMAGALGWMLWNLTVLASAVH